VQDLALRGTLIRCLLTRQILVPPKVLRILSEACDIPLLETGRLGERAVTDNEFRTWAHHAADWSADYLETVAERPVRAQVQPGDVLKQLPPHPPSAGEAMEAIFADLDRLILPGMTHWQHPRFFAYFPANSSPPSVIAEYVTATMESIRSCGATLFLVV
jgi:hypothetical protein